MAFDAGLLLQVHTAAPQAPLRLHRERCDHGGQSPEQPDAVRMSVFVVRVFVKMRELLGGTSTGYREGTVHTRRKPRAIVR